MIKKRHGKEVERANPAQRISAEALIHRRTRLAHQEERSEDYVEAIADLIRSSGEARVVQIALRMGVSHVTVIKIIKRLQGEGLVEKRPYKPIFLTQHGQRMAARAKRRHELVFKFLIAVGVEPKTAALDAEGIEHHVSTDTLTVFNNYIRLHEGVAGRPVKCPRAATAVRE